MEHHTRVAYASRKLMPTEQTYSTREQEALAILFAIEKFDCFLAGRKFTTSRSVG